jgi:hypothetical protein
MELSTRARAVVMTPALGEFSFGSAGFEAGTAFTSCRVVALPVSEK